MTAVKSHSKPLIPLWLDRVLAGVQGVIAGVTLLMCATAAYAMSLSLERNPTWLFVVFLAAGLLLLTVVHEAGHLLAARMAGMVIAGAQIGRVFLQAKRKGWRAHWTRSHRRVGGLAIAYPNPNTSLRRQFISMTVGGPLANVVCAAILAAPSLLLANGLARTFVVALCLGNLCTAIGNLIPTSRLFASDGFLLLRWFRGLPHDDVGVVYARVMGRSVFGTTADQLPPDEIAVLSAQPPPTKLVGLWFQVKAAQNRHDWKTASALTDSLEAAVEVMSPTQVSSVGTLIATLRAEIAFSAAIRDRDPRKLEYAVLSKANAAWVGYFPHRVDALRAALMGDISARDVALNRSAALAAEMPDLALEKSEDLIRTAIVALNSRL